MAIDADRDGDDEIVARAGDLRLWNQVGEVWAYTILSASPPTAIMRADVDGDGFEDLLAGFGSTEIRTAATGLSVVATVPQPIQGEAADLDGDGDLDIVGATQWWENRLGGTAWVSTALPALPYLPSEPAVGDVDGDGDPDLVLGDEYQGSSWLENDGTGFGWTIHDLGQPGGRTSWLVDVDEDGDLDYLRESYGLYVSLNDVSSPTQFLDFVEIVPFELGTWPTLEQVASIDGDIVILLQDGRWYTLAWPVVEAHPDLGWRTATSLGDLDADGATDLVTASVSRLAWWTGVPSAPVQHAVASEAPGSVMLAPSDVDHDGDQDVVAVGSGVVDWYENSDGYGVAWVPHEVFSDSGTIDYGVALAVADLDGDLDDDLVVYEDETDILTSWVADGTGAFVRRDLFGYVDGRALAVGDIDGDGIVELVTSAGWPHDFAGLTVWFGTGSNWVPLVVDETAPSYVANVLLLDVDNDGDLDIVGMGTTISWFDNRTGDGTVWTEVTIHSTPRTGTGGLRGIDFDRDGDQDLVGVASLVDYVLYEATLPLGQAWSDQSAGSSRPDALAVGDLDLNGTPDLVTSSLDDGLVVYENHTSVGGAPNFAGSPFGGSTGWAMILVDVDGDGDEDVVAHEVETGALRVHRNLSRHPADDRDGDGRPDAVDLCVNDYQVEDLDYDADGFAWPCDCNDFRATVWPGAPELCDATDNDCDGWFDEAFDTDSDGYSTCGWDGIPGTADDDCDDSRPEVRPGAVEQCDGLDDNCDGVMEPDADEDGAPACLECDDTDPTVFPGALEVPYDAADNDCDPSTRDDDLDLDGFGIADDCDDSDAALNPVSSEVPYDGADNDCNPDTLDDDLDADGFVLADDCDDLDPTVRPDAPEMPYDGVDNDCDRSTPDDDLDGDGFIGVDDCDDADANVSPSASEVAYDGVDNDCDDATPDDDLDADGLVSAEDCDDADPDVQACPEVAGSSSEGCGCAAGGPGRGVLVVGLLMVARRRGSPSRRIR